MINTYLNPQTLYKAPAKTSSKLYSKANTPVAFQGKKENNETDSNTIKLTSKQKQAAMAMLLTLATMASPKTSKANDIIIVNIDTDVLSENLSDCTKQAFRNLKATHEPFGYMDLNMEMLQECPDDIMALGYLPDDLRLDIIEEGRLLREELFSQGRSVAKKVKKKKPKSVKKKPVVNKAKAPSPKPEPKANPSSQVFVPPKKSREAEQNEKWQKQRERWKMD